MILISWIKKLKTDLVQGIPNLFRRYASYLRWFLRIIFALVFIEIGYIWGLMPDWDQFTHGPIQKSRMIVEYEYKQANRNDLPSLRWYPVPFKIIPEHLVRAVVVAEDSRFYSHKGFDQAAIKRAIEYNLSIGKFAYGASTISQQTIKNILLNPSKNPLRKLHEAILTFAMEQQVGKQRILEMYLNIAEFGPGIFGVDAAARHYFYKSVRQLTINESIELAATLPSPRKNNPATRSKQFIRHRDKIRAHLGFPI
ncbi:MAG: monofunctional biosynthetic peptidoglycan transglycosylase [Thiohalomonadales bacterium]